MLIENKQKEFLGVIKMSEIEENFNFKLTTIIGLGHIGLPLLVNLSKKNYIINGYDLDKKISNLKKGKINFFEENLSNNLKLNSRRRKLIY